MKSILYIVIGFALCIGITACGGSLTTTPASQTEAPAMDQSTGSIVTNQVQVTPERIKVTGTTNLPDGTCILTRLVDNQEDLSWWPQETCATITSGSWELEVPFGQNNAPDQLDPERSYLLHAWQKDAADNQAEPFPFELAPPMEADESNTYPTPSTELDAYPAPQSPSTSGSTTPYP
jgi:hypothetical protein